MCYFKLFTCIPQLTLHSRFAYDVLHTFWWNHQPFPHRLSSASWLVFSPAVQDSKLSMYCITHKKKCHKYRPKKRGYPPSLAVYMESASTASERELGEGVGKDARYMGTLWKILYYTFQSTCLHFSTPVERDPPCCTTYGACKDFHAWGWGRGLTWTQHLASSSASQIRTDTCGETADSNSTSSQMRNHQSFSQPLGLHPVPDSLTPSYA